MFVCKISPSKVDFGAKKLRASVLYFDLNNFMLALESPLRLLLLFISLYMVIQKLCKNDLDSDTAKEQ